MTERIAIFDFDDTLVAGDSLPLFVAQCVGWPWTLCTALAALMRNAHRRGAGFRDGFKRDWLRMALRGYPLVRLTSAISDTRARLRWNEPIRDRLRWHRQCGDRIIVASGGLDIYLTEMLRDDPPDHILCTVMERGGAVLTGAWTNANCVREEKARQVAALLAALPAVEAIWIYGNLPHDWPMMQLGTHRLIC